MKVVILCGGRGTRIGEETDAIPKPMIVIGRRPILWHIMKTYSYYGFNDFILCLGYKGDVIKNYFANYFLLNSDVTVDIAKNRLKIHAANISEPWKVTLVDTKLESATGGRIKMAGRYIGREPFMFTYGDGVADIDIKKLVRFHKAHGKLATISAVQPLGRFGALNLDARDRVCSFQEKPRGDNSWINGGYFVLEPKVLDYIDGKETIWEDDPVQKLSREGQLVAYRHRGFWKPLDTLREKKELEALWNTGHAPWKVWDEQP